MRHRTFHFLLAVAVILITATSRALAEDIRLTDNTHVNAMIEQYSPDKSELKVTTMDGNAQTIALTDIITITFRGRQTRMLPTGTQELRMIDGGRIRGRFVKNSGDAIVLDTDCLGQISLGMDNVKGFVSLPQIGRAGRWAQELLDQTPAAGTDQFLDKVIDRRGSLYEGVIRKLSVDDLDIDHDAMLKVVPIPITYLAGARFAPAAGKPAPAATTNLLLRISTRDGSRLDGSLNKISLGQWEVRPTWNPDAPVNVAGEEITDIQVLNSKRLYLSQLTPVAVKESTTFAPPQPYRMDRSCQGDTLTIGRHSYPWGIGVHARSELTFSLGKAFKTFQSGAGIDSHVGAAGSVIFLVFGDGKEIYKSPTIHGGEDEPHEISVDITGVDNLTLKVESAGESDLGDIANWAAAQVLR